MEGEWTYTETAHHKMFVTNPDGTKSPIKQEKVTNSKKTPGIHDSPAGGNAAHMSYIKDKAHVWIHRMRNGHLPGHIAWTAYKHQLWPGLRYGLWTMTNNLEPADGLGLILGGSLWDKCLSFWYESYGSVDLYLISMVIRAGLRLKGTKAKKSLFYGYH
jgi:hypothetical protein